MTVKLYLKNMLSVPRIQDSTVKILLAAIATGAVPLYIKYSPLARKQLKECFSIVAEQVANCGGESIFGWAILQLDGIWLEAEFHAIWQDLNGNLLDVTPREFPFPQVLFLPDPTLKYEGIQVESFFHPLTGHPAVLRNIVLQHELYIELNRGALAYASSCPSTQRIRGIKAELEYTLNQFPWQN